MSLHTIHSTWDVALARNATRKLILGQNCSPVLCARAVAALAALGELVLLSKSMGTLEIALTQQEDKLNLALHCTITSATDLTAALETTRHQLLRAVDKLAIENVEDRLSISSYLRLV